MMACEMKETNKRMLNEAMAHMVRPIPPAIEACFAVCTAVRV